MSPKTIALSTLRCPECGAPAKVEPGTSFYLCKFCNTSLLVERPAAPPPGPAPIAPPFGDASKYVPLEAIEHRSGQKSGCGPVIAVIAVLAAIGVGAAVILGRTGVLAKAGLVSWDGKERLVCSGNEWITVDHVTAKFDKGIAIDASGNCNVNCKDCKLGAPTVVRARENASVHLDHGKADGEVFAETSENADVTNDHTKTTGKTIEPNEKHSFDKPAWPKTGPFVCGKSNGGGEFSNVTVKVDSGAAIIGSVNCGIKLKHCKIEGPVGILLSDNASIELEDCEVRAKVGVIARANGSVVLEEGTFVGTEHAAVLADNANLRAHGTHYQGDNTTVGNATAEVE